MQHHLVSNHSYISVAQQYRSLSAFPRIPSSCDPLPPLATRKLANSLITSCVLFGRLHRKKQIKWRDQVAVTSSPCTVEYHKVAKGIGGVFGSGKVREKIVVARFGFIWQLLSNYGVISFKRFVSSFTTKLCN